jgi:transposase
MKGQQPPQGSLFACVRLEEMIPSDHLLRRIQRAIDFRFIDRLTEPLYSGMGRPSIPPPVLVRMMVVGVFGVSLRGQGSVFGVRPVFLTIWGVNS